MSNEFIHNLQARVKKCKLKWDSFAEKLVPDYGGQDALLH